MNFAMDANQRMVQKLAKEFAERYIAPRVKEIEREKKVPKDLFDRMAKTGFVGITFPKEYGGAALGQDCLVLAFEQLSKVSLSANMSVIVSIMFLQAINLFGTEQQKEQYIPAGINGDICGALAFTEAGTGSDPKQLTSTYREEGDCYVINGVKRFITNASYPGPMLVYANHDTTEECTAFVIDKFCEGYSLSTVWDTVGAKGSPVYDVFMDQIRVPKERVLGQVGGGFDVLKGTVAYSKIALSATFIGTMGASFDAAVRYAKEKVHRGRSISKFANIQTKVAQIEAMYESARLLVYKLGCDASDPEKQKGIKAQSAMVKAYVSDLAVQSNFLCMNILGAYGVCEEYHIERFLRDSLIGPHIEGVSDLQRIIAGSHTLRQ